jgi:hypothetical protein
MEPVLPDINVDDGDSLWVPIGDPDEDFLAFPKPLVSNLAAVLYNAHISQRKPGNIVMGRYFYADKEADSLALNLSIVKGFQRGDDPLTVYYPHRYAPVRLWIREGANAKAPTLLTNDKVQFRAINSRSVALFSTLRSLWPPPLIIGPTLKHSIMWTFKLTSVEKERESLYTLALALGEEYVGNFAAVVRYMATPMLVLPNPWSQLAVNKGLTDPGVWSLQLMQKNGEPVQYTDSVTSWLKSSTNGLIDPASVKATARCCACMRAPPFSTTLPHHAGECGLLTSFNRIRSQVGIRPMHVEHGFIDPAPKKTVITPERLAVYVEKELRGLKGTIAALTKRVAELEAGKKKKKRKLAPSSATGKTDPKKAKVGSGTGKASGSGQAKKGAAGGKVDKGKGKATSA